MKTVADYMTAQPLCVSPQTPIKEAMALLASHSISGVPVTDEAGQALGVLSESDLLWQASGVTPPAYILLLDSVIYLQNPTTYERDLHKALGQTVGEVMTGKPVCVPPDCALSEAARIMHERNIRRLLVTEEGLVVGVLTQGDVVRAMVEGFDGLA